MVESDLDQGKKWCCGDSRIHGREFVFYSGVI